MTSREMTTQQKAMALRALGGLELHIRERGDWYAYVKAEIKRDGVLSGHNSSSASPEEAIDAAFFELATSGVIVVLNAGRQNRREVWWNGFMWEDVA